MKFTEVKDIPRARHNLQLLIKEFMSQNIKCVRVDLKEGEYSTLNVAYGSMYAAVKKSGEPIAVRIIDGSVHLVRKDM